MSRYLFEKNEKNHEVRKAISKSGLRYYEVAELIGVHPCTLSSWLARNMPREKKEAILDALEQVKLTTTER